MTQTLRRLEYIGEIAFCPDGRLLAGAGQSGSVYLWDVDTGRQTTLQEDNKAINRLVFSPDGRRLAAVTSDMIRLWDIATGKAVFTLVDTTDFQQVKFHPDGRRLLTTTQWGTIKVWDSLTGQELFAFPSQKRMPFVIPAFSADGRCLIAGGLLWDAGGRSPARTMVNSAGSLGLAYSPDSRYLFTGSQDQSLQTWDLATGQRVRAWTGCGAVVTNLAVSPDGRLIAGAWQEGLRILGTSRCC